MRKKEFQKYAMLTWIAAPFLFPGLYMASRGDETSNTTLASVGVAVFLIGFVWIGYCALRALRVLLRD